MKNKTYSKVTKKLSGEIIGQIVRAKDIVITSHISPDDDSIASVLSMYYILINYLKIPEKSVRVMISQEKVSNRWESFEGFNKIKFVNDIYNELSKGELLIILDGSGWDRISRNPKISEKFSGKVICIDHHPKPSNIFDTHIVAAEYSSTSELLFHLFLQKEKLDKPICELILLGLIGDTGRFKYIEPKNARSFDVAKKMVVDGNIKIEDFGSKYESVPFKVYKIYASMITRSEIYDVENWPKFIVSYITREELEGNSYSQEDLSYAKGLFTEILKSFQGISWGLVFSPDIYGTNISGRSLPDSVSIRDIMERLDIGGGHDRAAGGKLVEKDTQKAMSLILDWISNNKPVIR